MVANRMKRLNKYGETPYILRLSPESYELFLQAGLLACPNFSGLPIPAIGTVAGLPKLFAGLTATGIAPVFNRVPF